MAWLLICPKAEASLHPCVWSQAIGIDFFLSQLFRIQAPSLEQEQWAKFMWIEGLNPVLHKPKALWDCCSWNPKSLPLLISLFSSLYTLSHWNELHFNAGLSQWWVCHLNTSLLPLWLNSIIGSVSLPVPSCIQVPVCLRVTLIQASSLLSALSYYIFLKIHINYVSYHALQICLLSAVLHVCFFWNFLIV